MAMKQPRFEIWKSNTGWRWTLRARNGKVVADSGESYSSKRKALQAAENMKKVVSRAIIWAED